jgi:hypothetical protein
MSRNHDITARDFDDLLDKQFLGIIVDIEDPRKEGRAKVRVASIYDEIPVEDIPWAFPKNRGTVFGQAGKGGAVSIPKLNAVVAVVFDNGNPYSPEYFSLQELADDIKEELNSEYAGSHIVLFDGDQELKIWFSVSKGLTLILKEASINIDPENQITIKTGNKVIVDSPAIELGVNALEAVIKGETFQKIFNAHTHIGNLGAPTSTPIVPLNGSELSKVTKTE